MQGFDWCGYYQSMPTEFRHSRRRGDWEALYKLSRCLSDADHQSLQYIQLHWETMQGELWWGVYWRLGAHYTSVRTSP